MNRFHNVGVIWGLEAEFDVGVGAVDSFVTASTPASALVEAAGSATCGIGWAVTTGGAHGIGAAGMAVKVALEAESGIPLGEHLLIHRTVRIVAGGATFFDCIVGKDEWTHLSLVALGAGFIIAVELRAATFDGIALVRVMAIRAGHLAVQHLVGVGQAELGFFVQVALEAGFRGFIGIHDRARAAAGFNVFAAWAVAGFAAHIDGVGSLGLKFGMICGFEVTDGFLVALGAFFRSDEGGPGDARRSHHRAAGRGAGNQDQCR